MHKKSLYHFFIIFLVTALVPSSQGMVKKAEVQAICPTCSIVEASGSTRALLSAIRERNEQKAAKAIEDGADVNFLNPLSEQRLSGIHRPPLMVALEDFTAILIEAQRFSSNQFGNTQSLSMYAFAKARLQIQEEEYQNQINALGAIIDLLLKNNAQVNFTDHTGNSAFVICAEALESLRNSNLPVPEYISILDSIMQLLRKAAQRAMMPQRHRAPMNNIASFNTKALLSAIKNHNAQNAAEALQDGADANFLTRSCPQELATIHRGTPLMMAMTELTKLIIRTQILIHIYRPLGSVANAQIKESKIVCAANISELMTIIELLLRNNAQPNFYDHTGNSAFTICERALKLLLHDKQAAEVEYVSILRTLLIHLDIKQSDLQARL